MMPNDWQSNTEVKMMLEWNRESDWKLIMGEKSYGGGSLVHVPLFNDEKKGQCWWVLAVDGDAMQCVWGWCPLEKGTDQQERKLVVAAMVSHMWWRRLCGEDGFFFPFNFFFFLVLWTMRLSWVYILCLDDRLRVMVWNWEWIRLVFVKKLSDESEVDQNLLWTNWWRSRGMPLERRSKKRKKCGRIRKERKI